MGVAFGEEGDNRCLTNKLNVRHAARAANGDRVAIAIVCGEAKEKGGLRRA
jgi:hypothetical protein